MTHENGPGMYRVEPYYDFSRIPVELPTCMFKMASYHEQAGDSKVDPQLVELEQRQESILQELKSLEKEVASLVGRTQKVACATDASTDKESVDLGSTIHDIVIYANPAQPPLSVVVLYQMLKRRYRCRSAVHVHSSVKSRTEGLLGHFGNGLEEMTRNEAQVSLTLIWKDVSDGPVLMVAAPSQSPIHGEANVARYVARLLDAGHDSADPARAGALDQWLDLASGPLRSAAQRERAAALRSLNARLGKRDWLAGAAASVADVVCWSVVQGTGQAAGAPANVQKWLKACSEQSVFKMASGLIA